MISHSSTARALPELKVRHSVADVVRSGLGSADKTLPAWLFYDDAGSELFELITELPEYYLTRTERALFERYGEEIVSQAAGSAPRLNIVELGAGTATKSQILLRAAVERQGRCLYVPIDVSLAALDVAATRIAREEPGVEVRPIATHHAEAVRRLAQIPARRLVLFIGSSIGNFEDAEAQALLSSVRTSLAPGDAFLLGADRKKSPERLLPAYDDASGVTAAFNKNILARINRELGGEFELDAFRHVALWNEELSRVESYLESLRPQRVRVAELDAWFSFDRGERIHTESSHKYSDAHIERLLSTAGFVRERSFFDDEGLFGVHLARVAGSTSAP